MQRIFFLNKMSRDYFFQTIKNYSKKSWRKIAREIGTTRAMLEKYRKGSLSLPEERFVNLLKMTPLEQRSLFLRSIKKKEENWGQVIGGRIAYKLNKKAK